MSCHFCIPPWTEQAKTELKMSCESPTLLLFNNLHFPYKTQESIKEQKVNFSSNFQEPDVSFNICGNVRLPES